MYYYKLNKTNRSNGSYNLVIAKSLYCPLYFYNIILENIYKDDQYILPVSNDIILQMIKDNRVKGNEAIFNILIAEDIGLQLIENNIISKK